MGQYILFLLAGPVVARLPRRALTLLGVGLGVAAYVLARGPRRAVQRNLAHVRPDWTSPQRRRAAIQTFIHSAWGYLELLGLGQLSPGEIARDYPLVGWENVEAALAAGNGAIVVTAHLGAFTIAGQRLVGLGPPPAVVVEQIQPPRLFALVTRLRSRFGVRLLAADRSAIRPLLAALRNNEIVGIIGDRDVAGTGDWLPFFGEPARMTSAPATLARRSGAVILPSVAVRTGVFRGAAWIGPPIPVPRTADVAADVREGTKNVIKSLETIIREHPEQWIVFEDIWRYGTIPTPSDVAP